MIQEQLRKVGIAATAAHDRDPCADRGQPRRTSSTPRSRAGRSTPPSISSPTSIRARAPAATTSASYRNAEVDRLLDAARRAPTPEAALPDLLRMQQILHAEQPYTFLWEPQRLCAVRAELTEVQSQLDLRLLQSARVAAPRDIPTDRDPRAPRQIHLGAARVLDRPHRGLLPPPPAAGRARRDLRGSARAAGAALRLRAIYGLDRPLPEQYLRWLGGVARGEWGYSLSQHRPVGQILRETAPNTLLLSGAALLLELGLGLALGVAAARARTPSPTGRMRVLSITLWSLPTFWLGLMLLAAFAVALPLFPPGRHALGRRRRPRLRPARPRSPLAPGASCRGDRSARRRRHGALRARRRCSSGWVSRSCSRRAPADSPKAGCSGPTPCAPALRRSPNSPASRSPHCSRARSRSRSSSAGPASAAPPTTPWWRATIRCCSPAPRFPPPSCSPGASSPKPLQAWLDPRLRDA